MKKFNELVYVICIGLTISCGAMDTSSRVDTVSSVRVRPGEIDRPPLVDYSEDNSQFAPQAPLLKVPFKGAWDVAGEVDGVHVRPLVVKPRETGKSPSKS